MRLPACPRSTRVMLLLLVAASAVIGAGAYVYLDRLHGAQRAAIGAAAEQLGVQTRYELTSFWPGRVRLVSFADPNGDGTVTRAEASSAANFLIGGFFFRADGNGDGVVTPQEGLQVRKDFMNEQPVLSSLLQSARDAGSQSPFAAIAQLLDVEYGQPVRAEQARATAKSAVDNLFAWADKNKDGELTEAEARNASLEGAQAAGRAMFRAIDANNDNQVSEAEFRNSLEGPAAIAFKMADKNSDGHLTQAEASNAVAQVAVQLSTPSRSAKR